MEQIEDKEIRGITIKQLLWLIGTLSGILITVILTYASINNKLNNLINDRDVKDLQIKTINVELQAVEIRLVRLETQISSESRTHKD